VIGFDVVDVRVMLETNVPEQVLSELVAASPVADTLHNRVHLDIALNPD
jgi:hypothetical protein